MVKLLTNLATRYSSLNWVIVDQVMVSGVNFLTSIIMARLLGIEEFGVFALAWLVVLFASGIQTSIIISPLISIGPKQDRDKHHLYFTSLCVHQVAFMVVAFLAVWGAGTFASSFNPDWDFSAMALATAAAAIAFTFQDFVRRYFFTQDKGRAAFINDAISYLGQLVILLACFKFAKIDGSDALWIVCATSAFAAVVGLPGLPRPAWSRSQFIAVSVRHWHFSKWLLASSIIHWASGNSFIVAAAALLGTPVVGAVNAAQRIMGITHVYTLALSNLVPRRASQHFHESGSRALRRYLGKAGVAGGSVTIMIALVAAAFPEFWLEITYGPEFTAYAEVLQWFAAISVVTYFVFVLRSGLRAVEYTKPIALANAIALAFALPSAYPLVEWLGVRGIMIGTLSMQVIYLLVFASALHRELRRHSVSESSTVVQAGLAEVRQAE